MQLPDCVLVDRLRDNGLAANGFNHAPLSFGWMRHRQPCEYRAPLVADRPWPSLGKYRQSDCKAPTRSLAGEQDHDTPYRVELMADAPPVVGPSLGRSNPCEFCPAHLYWKISLMLLGESFERSLKRDRRALTETPRSALTRERVALL